MSSTLLLLLLEMETAGMHASVQVAYGEWRLGLLWPYCWVEPTNLQ